MVRRPHCFLLADFTLSAACIPLLSQPCLDLLWLAYKAAFRARLLLLHRNCSYYMVPMQRLCSIQGR